MCVILRRWKEDTAELTYGSVYLNSRSDCEFSWGYSSARLLRIPSNVANSFFFLKRKHFRFFVFFLPKQMLAFIYFITVYKFVCRDFDFKLINDVKRDKTVQSCSQHCFLMLSTPAHPRHTTVPCRSYTVFHIRSRRPELNVYKNHF